MLIIFRRFRDHDFRREQQTGDRVIGDLAGQEGERGFQHGDVDELPDAHAIRVDRHPTTGRAWVLSFADPELIAADPLPPL